jgi:translation initiation factor 4G
VIRPERKAANKIVIKSADGQVINLKDLASQNTTAPKSGPPMIVASAGIPSTPTPPPPPPSETPQPPKSDEQTAKEAEEKKRNFVETVAASLKKQSKESESKTEDSEKPSVTSEPSIANPVLTSDEKAKDTPKEEQKEEVSSKAPTPEDSVKPESTDDGEEEEEEDEIERMIREMEENERLDAERQAKYEEKKKAEAEVRIREEKEEATKQDEELKRAEREAEERESAKTGEVDEEAAKLFASLKKSTLGPSAAESSGPPTPGSDSMPPPSSTPPTAKPLLSSRHRPQTLKLETTKAVEPAQPTAGMQSLSSARMLQLQSEISYPAGIQSPNPAINHSGKGRGFHYDKDFLLQFQDVFKEKPNINWDKTLKETVGDGGDSARPQSAARTPSMGGRGGSHRGGPPQAIPSSLAMGQFSAGGRTLPPGTTSADRFAASNQVRMGQPPAMQNPFAQFANRPTGMPFPLQAPSMSRTGSSQRNLSSTVVPGGRQGSSRSKGGRNEKDMARTMPLTAGKEVKSLEVSKSGWKASSLSAAGPPLPVAGLMPPDVVQRKVKASLNKMTPEKFDKISDDILAIANQSVHETDGRTLRQVIQLTFEKACDEAHWGPMYAKFCMRMQSTMSKDIKDEGIRDRNGDIIVGGNLFRKYLLNRCQEEFERGWEINLPPKPEGQDEVALLSDEYYLAVAAKRRGLGLIQFIGELYKLGMLNIRIMHECVLKLLNFEGLPDESGIESLVKLLRTIGSAMEESEKGPAMINVYFDRINSIMHMDGLPSRLYYMLLDTVDLRRNRWKSKDDAKGPKTLQEIHREAQQNAIADAERAKTAARTGRPPMGRNDSRNYSGSPSMQPNDYSRNQVGMDDLKKLAGRNRPNAGSSTSLVPSGLLSNRSGSGRRGLGPPTGEQSGQSSRTGTPPVKESITSKNAFE